MTERLLGMETEYGLSVIRSSGANGDTQNAAEELVSLARQLPHLPGLRSGGLFMANGSRFYVDCGSHPELATPECANPWDVCRYLQAGDRLLTDLAAQFTKRERTVARTLVLKNNVDYQTRATWGSHESYLHRGTGQGALSRQIIPHLVSRLLYSGAGGFNCFSPGLEFMLSPRVAYLHNTVSPDSTSSQRGIFHTRDEALCGRGYGRLHILCGESLSGQTGAWLKVATTALVVALIEAGKRPGEAVQFADPLAAMRAFAGDPSCQRTAPLADGREVTALAVQRHYLECAEAHAADAFMPPWAGEVCRHWRAILVRLQHGAGAVGTTLDWAIKLALFQAHARRRGTSLEALAAWSPVLARLSAELVDEDGAPHPLPSALARAPKSPVARVKRDAAPLLGERGLDWADLDSVLALRLELFEIDVRYGLLGEGGLFTALDRSGVLDHRFAGVDNIPHALENPPATGRAALRGGCIRRVAGQRGKFAAEWDGVFDLEHGHQLNLADPFCSAEQWQPHDQGRREPPSVGRLFRDGRYADFLDRVAAGAAADVDDIVLSYSRLGRRDEALDLLRRRDADEHDFHQLALEMWVLSDGLVPDIENIRPLVELGDRLQETPGWPDHGYSRFIFLSYKAVWLMHRGLHALAEALFVALLADPANATRSRMFARTQCYLAELYRQLGWRHEAEALVEQAGQTHQAEGLHGDAARHSLPMQAKLAADADQAAVLLLKAESFNQLQRNNLGIAHIRLLRARILHDPTYLEAIVELQHAVPVLRQCPLAQRIVREWDAWCAPATGDAPVDYWGL